MEKKKMIGRKVKFQRFKMYEGWRWELGGEGEIIAETETFYKVKTGWFANEWVYKDKVEEIYYL